MISRTSLLILFLARTASFASDPVAQEDAGESWKLVATSHELTIHSRPRVGSALKEFKASGVIAAPTSAVNSVLDDVEAYPSFMPYTTECRVLTRESESVVLYQRLSPPFVSDRDYTLRIRETSQREEGGLAFQFRWELANALGPAEQPGVARVKISEGSWLLEPHGAHATRATYSIYTDSGGTLPAFVANRASQIAIGKLFRAVRKQVTNPKYM